jgi:nucleoside-diphosphate-sugar epimerase
MRIAITGSGGYVGSAIAAAAKAQGHTVISFTRQRGPEYDWRAYDLSTPVAATSFEDIDVVVHAAYDLSVTSSADITRVNVDGTHRLLDASLQAGARVCLISSMSAYDGTKQLYGRAKLAAEQDVVSAGGVAVRLGLVYGGSDGGMMGSLRRLAALPVTPIFGADSHQFLVHVQDMAQGVIALVDEGDVNRTVVSLAHPTPLRFGRLIKEIAKSQGKNARLIPIPWRTVYTLMRFAEVAHVPLPIRADSVLGLVHPAPGVRGFGLWESLGVSVAPFDLNRP